MKKSSYTKVLVFFGILFVISCNSLKHVGDGDYLLVANDIIVIKNYSSKSKKEKKNNDRSNLYKLIEQSPNVRSLLGVPIRLYIYNIADSIPSENFDTWVKKKDARQEHLERLFSGKQVNRLKDSYIKANEWLKKIGESPAVLNIEDVKKTIKKIKSYENNMGYLDAKISYHIDSLPKHRAKVKYYVRTNKPYVINQISSDIESSTVDSIYKRGRRYSLIKKGDRYNLEVLEKERNRITKLCRNSGLYTFQKSVISFEAYLDTISKKDNKIDLKVVILEQTVRQGDSTLKKPYKVRTIEDVGLYIGKNNMSYTDSLSYKNINIYFKDKLVLNPKILDNGISIKKGGLYRDLDRDNTYKYFNSFRTLKYSIIDFKNDLKVDSLFHAKVYIFPKSRFSLKFNTDLSNSPVQDFGIALNTSMIMRNLFRRGEILEISPRGSIGFQKQINDLGTKIISEYGGDIKLYIPRILFLSKVSRFITSNMKPQTQISIGTSFQKNIGLDKQSINAAIRYSWSPKLENTHIVEPLGVEYIQNLNTENFYRLYSTTYNTANNLSKTNPILVNPEDINEKRNLIAPEGVDRFLNNLSKANQGSDTKTANNILFRKKRLTNNNIIFGSKYTYIFNTKRSIEDNNFFRLTAHTEFSGNLISLLSKSLSLKKDNEGRYTINGIPYSQYAKVNLDLSKHTDLNNDKVLVFHSFLGLTIPFGNSKTVPFLKSYFAGGVSDNRGWLAYSLGPGRNNALLDFNDANFKIATNLEYRFPLVGDLKGALFIDAGNVWNIWDDTKNEKALFQGFSSLKDIAISSGFGFRYDLRLLVLRLDIGLRTYNPALPSDKRWLSEFSFLDSVFNFAINYPF